MNTKEQFVILKAFEKVLKDALKDVSADVKADLMEINDGEGITVNVRIGGEVAKLALICPTGKELVGRGEEFMQFMREHEMTRETVDDAWKQCVTVAGNNVLWDETGEVVPGVSVQVVSKAAYPKVTSMKAGEILFAARESGMFEAATTPLLGGSNGA